MAEADPGAPEVVTAVTPVARPCKLWSSDVMTDPFRACSLIDDDEPERSLFFIVP